MPKAVFLDIDGTLLSFKTRSVPESAINAMTRAKEKGVKLFIATGRHKNELGSNSNIHTIPFDGYVTQNGAYCYTNEKIIYSCPLKKHTVNMFFEYLQKDPFTCFFCAENDMFINRKDANLEQLLEKFGLPVPPISDPVRAVVSDVFMLVPFLEEKKESILYSLPDAKVTKWFDGCYDIVNINVNKWLGILKMIEHFGISKEETATIGDGENDIEMLSNSKFSVAMGNAKDHVKKHAKYVTTHIDEDGIANAFKHLFGPAGL